MVISGILLSCQNIRYYFVKKCNSFIFTVDIKFRRFENKYSILLLFKVGRVIYGRRKN